MQKVLLGPYKTGLQNNLNSIWLPNEAYDEIEDAYVWRGKTKRKEGYQFLGRLHYPGTTALPIAAGVINAGDFTVTFAPFAAGDLPLSAGTVRIRIASVAPWPANIDFVDNGNGTLTCSAAAAGGFILGYGIINYNTGAFTLFVDPVTPAGPWAVTVTAFRRYSRSPCMGLGLYEQDIVNQERLFAFDQVRAYLYNTGTEVFDVTTNAALANDLWSGTNVNFFWTTNYYRDSSNNSLFWATNNVANTAGPPARDGIQIFNGVFWYAQQPAVDGVNFLRGCLLLVPYRGRMVALNTLEGIAPPGASVRYPNRARWSQNGVPYTNGLGGADANAWLSNVAGRGGFIDAPTSQAIVSCAFVKDTLIVFFERSTWQLRYTGYEVLPFIWEQVDSELGSESTFSSVVFDKGVLSIGDKGIIAANSISVERIDSKIPDFVFNIDNDISSPIRVQGIRDFMTKLVYWTYSDGTAGITFPDKMLVYNYDEGSYSIFNDTFTCFNYIQITNDLTWGTLPYASWSKWINPWSYSFLDAYAPNICAGNHQGIVSILNVGGVNDIFADLATPVALSATNPCNCNVPAHNLKSGQFVKISSTRAFPVVVFNEVIGTVANGGTAFKGTLLHDGVIAASAPTALGPPFVSIDIGGNVFTDVGNGNLVNQLGAAAGTINYDSGEIQAIFPGVVGPVNVLANYDYNIINARTFYVNVFNANVLQLYDIDQNTELPTGVNAAMYANYNGWGEIAQVSNFKLKSKRYNPYLEEGGAVRINYFDALLDVSALTFKANIYADSANNVSVEEIPVSCADEYAGPGLGLDKKMLWKRIYSNTVSDFVQFEFTLSKYQMTQEDIYANNLVLQTVLVDFDRAGRNINRS